jgi:mannose-6-phosphate isomerase-like protein (cupin superfamily)
MAELIVPGDVLHDIDTGSHVTIIELRPDGFIIEQMVEPNKAKSKLNHFHQTWTEVFEIVSGTGRYRLDDQVYEAAPGHSFTVRPGQAHIHPWNTGTEELRFRQSDVFDPPDATAAVDTFLAFSTLFGLAREGKLRDGTPRNPFQAFVVFDFFRKHGGYAVGAAAPIQDVLIAIGGVLGRLLRFRGWYEKYLPRYVNQ